MVRLGLERLLTLATDQIEKRFMVGHGKTLLG